MKHRAWFTLVIKAIGLLLVGFGLETFVGFLLAIFFVTFPHLDETGYYTRQDYGVAGWTILSLGNIAQIGFGLYLLFGSKALIDWCLRRAAEAPPRSICIHCGYDLSMTSGETCPECGKDRVAGPAPTSTRKDAGTEAE